MGVQRNTRWGYREILNEGQRNTQNPKMIKICKENACMVNQIGQSIQEWTK